MTEQIIITTIQTIQLLMQKATPTDKQLLNESIEKLLEVLENQVG